MFKWIRQIVMREPVSLQSPRGEPPAPVIVSRSALIDAEFSLGERAFSQGAIDVAERHWRKTLALAPDHEAVYLALCHLSLAKSMPEQAARWIEEGIAALPDSATLHYYRGNLQFQAQQFSLAESSFRGAIALQPQRADVLSNLGLALLALERPEAALECLLAATEIDPGLASAFLNLGHACVALKRPDDAIRYFQRTAALEPQNVEAHFNLGNALFNQERFDDAVASYRTATALATDRPDVHSMLGSAMLRQGRAAQALDSLRHVLTLTPASVEAHYNVATALQSLGRTAEAEAIYRAALALVPTHPESLFNLGTLLEAAGDAPGAAQCYEQLIQSCPDHVAALCNLGRCFESLFQFDKAEACYRQALEIDGNFAIARNNLSDVLMHQNKLDEAVACYDAILARAPDDATLHFNKSLALLGLGNYSLGWLEYEHRWRCDGAPAKPAFAAPEWDGGQTLEGKTVLLYGEQGFGDTLQFIRYATVVAQRGATVLAMVPQPLQVLVASCHGVAKVFIDGENLPPIDYHCPLMSLPLLCGTQLHSIPARVPYLAASREKQILWRERLGNRSGLRVGLAWAGNPRKHHLAAQAADRQRSVHFDRIAPLLDVEGVEFYSLQLGEDAVAQLKNEPRVIDLTAGLHDFDETAAFVSNLDLVISVDTSVVHLAGAIGKPVWVLNRYNTCWRWLNDRSDSPWYPTARVFRQPSFGDWHSVVSDARRALEELAAARLPHD